MPKMDLLGIEGDLTGAEMDDRRAELGLDRPWVEQFVIWARAAAGGDLGLSLRFNRPVSEMLLHAAPTTATLAVLAMSLGITLGVGLAVVVFAVGVIVANALADLAHRAADPRAGRDGVG